MIHDIQERTEGGLSVDEAAEALVRDYRASKRKLSGLGHRVHTADPRTRRLLELAEAYGVAAEGVVSIQALQAAFTRVIGKTLPVNVDGALAAILVDLGIPPELGNAFFMMARTPGLVAQITEEKQREKPMRVIYPNQSVYDGPEPE